MLICHSYILFGEVHFKIFCPFFFYKAARFVNLWNFNNSLYIPYISVLFQMSDLQIFSPSLWLIFFTPLIVVFMEQKFLILMGYDLSVLSYMGCAFKCHNKISLPKQGHKDSSMFSYKTFIDLYLRSIIHFELINFCKDVWCASKFIFFMYVRLIFPATFIEKIFLLPSDFLASLSTK